MRKCNDWLWSYVQYTANQESPSIFHLWVGLSVLAATLDRRIYFDKAYYMLYPNLYVILVGPSARVRKSVAIGCGHTLFKLAFPDEGTVSQKITPEALIKVFGDAFKAKGTSSGYIVNSELGVFLSASARDAGLIQLLTKMYDSEDILDYHTIGRGKEKCEKICCNMLGATTPDWLKTGMPEHAVGGGFTSRVIFVYQDKPDHLDPFPKITPAMLKMKGDLVEDLKEIREISGEFTLSQDAREWYETWYMQVFKGSDEEDSSKALSGYYGRKHDTMLKLGMILSASKGNSMQIEEGDFKVALNALNTNEKTLYSTVELIEVTTEGRDNEKIFKAIRKSEGMFYSTILRRMSYCMNSKRVNEVLELLTNGEMVKETIRDGKRYFEANN